MHEAPIFLTDGTGKRRACQEVFRLLTVYEGHNSPKQEETFVVETLLDFSAFR